MIVSHDSINAANDALDVDREKNPADIADPVLVVCMSYNTEDLMGVLGDVDPAAKATPDELARFIRCHAKALEGAVYSHLRSYIENALNHDFVLTTFGRK